ncbi:hypothetical protein JRQ81_006021 [Phrynocephalus forsythii]|uniref:Putative nucleotidyltransferase MAB21L1 n=1 Tax=Phrynocephalus forsythii TaxID=171643 RepID=A0A9Q0XGY5_9SAUR|nr:hypothetical protein JRQ81_006021 [Phrynocephalus forsythii]
MDPGDRERCLQQFYADHVFLLGDKDWRVGKNFFVVKTAVEKVVKWAYESSTGLFPGGAVPAGSYAEGLHLQVAGRSNGFDFLVPVRYNPRLALVSGSLAKDAVAGYKKQLPTYIFRDQGLPVFRRGTQILVDLEALGETYVKVFCDKPEGGSDDYEDDDRDLDHLEACEESLNYHNLDPVQILRDFHHHVEIALNPEYSHPRQNDPVFQQRLFPSRVPKIDQRMREKITLEALDVDGPAIRLTFDEGVEAVPVKLVPAIQGSVHLSNQCVREDLTHLSDWWDGDAVDEKSSFLRKAAAVQETGPELVAKGGFWRLSFSQAEALILDNIDADGGQRKAALRLLKFVNKTRWTPEYGNILTSYHLKTVLLWCYDIYPQKAQWETLSSSLKALLGLLRHTLTKGNLPHYFLASVNLLNRCYKSSNPIDRSLVLEALCRETEVMLADPVGYLRPERKPQDYNANEEYEEKMAALEEFKEKYEEELKELKRMEGGCTYDEMETTQGAGAEASLRTTAST